MLARCSFLTHTKDLDKIPPENQLSIITVGGMA
jgi:hypothetical protein